MHALRAELEEKTEQLTAATSAVAVLEEQLRQAGEAAEAAAAARAQVDASLESTAAALQAAQDRCEAAEVRVSRASVCDQVSEHVWPDYGA